LFPGKEPRKQKDYQVPAINLLIVRASMAVGSLKIK
jgi:hypothetical protein